MRTAPSKPPTRRGDGPNILLLLLLAPAVLLMMPTSALLAAGLLPTFVAYIIDRDPEKSATMTVGAMNLCGVTPFIVRLWQNGHEMGVSMRMLADPGTWLVMFGSAAVGWLMYFFIPQIVAAFTGMRNEARIKELEEMRSALIADWGTDILARPDDKPEPAGLMDDPPT